MGKRIFVGTSDIAKNVSNIAKGFRDLGYETDTLVYAKSKFYPNASYTLEPPQFLENMRYRLRPDGTVGVELNAEFIKFVENYDIFVFVAGSSLLPRMVDLPILRQMGKTIVSRHCGTEVRDAHLARIFWKDYGLDYPLYDRDVNARRVRIEHEGDVLQVDRYTPAFVSKMHSVRTSELYADLVTCGPASHTLGLRPYVQTGPPIDLEHFSFRIPRRKVPVILHAPTHMVYKRTDAIVDMLEELHEEGLRFHLELLHDVPHEVVRAKLAEADILIDELACGTGMLAYEGAAAGCAVLGGHDGISSPLPRNRPVLHTTVETFKDRVRKVVQDVAYRTRLAVLGREYIDSGVSSPASVAGRILEALEQGQAGLDLYPTLFAERAFLPQGESVPGYLKQRALEVLRHHGAHPDTNLARLAHEGFLPALAPEAEAAIPRWDVSGLVQEGPWILTGPGATFGSPVPVPEP